MTEVLIETSPLICSAYQWIGFYMKGFPVMKEVTGVTNINPTSNLKTQFNPIEIAIIPLVSVRLILHFRLNITKEIR